MAALREAGIALEEVGAEFIELGGVLQRGVGVGDGAAAYHLAQALDHAVVVRVNLLRVRAQLGCGAEFQRADGHDAGAGRRGGPGRAEGEFRELLHQTRPFL